MMTVSISIFEGQVGPLLIATLAWVIEMRLPVGFKVNVMKRIK